MFCRASISCFTLIILAECFIDAEVLSQTKERDLNLLTDGDKVLPKDEPNAPEMIQTTPFNSSGDNKDFLLQGDETGVVGEIDLPPREVNQEDGKSPMSREKLSVDPSYRQCVEAVKQDFLKAKQRDLWGKRQWDYLNEKFAKIHNYFRRRHGAQPLVISQGMMNEAQNWAMFLACSSAFHPTNSNVFNDMGQNLFSLETDHRLESIPVEEVVKSWYEGHKFYTYGWDIADDEVKAMANKFAHFTQLVWKGTSLVGCGTASSRNKLIVVCNYYRRGNDRHRFKKNVLPVRLYYRMADPMKENLRRLMPCVRSKELNSTEEAFRKMRKQIYERGDGVMAAEAAVTAT